MSKIRNTENVEGTTNDLSGEATSSSEHFLSFEQNLTTALIRKINFTNPGENDKEKLAEITSGLFLEKYKKYDGIPELAKRFKTGFRFVSKDEFVEETDDGNSYDKPGVHLLDKHLTLINKDVVRGNADFDYSTFLHEAHHFFSIENGAGFSLESSMGFSYPDEIYGNAELSDLLSFGSLSLCEGTTQLLATEMHHALGFEFYNDTYPVETDLAIGIRDIVGKETFEKAFFTMPLEEIRLKFESLAVSPDEEIDDDFFNGDFSYFLIDLGDRVKYCNEILSKYQPQDEPSKDDKDEIGAVINECLEKLDKYIHQHNRSITRILS